MIYFNNAKGKHYFEGWFFRIFADGFNCALIPSISISEGEKRAFVQVNCNGFSKKIEFDFEAFSADHRQVVIGGNRFFDEGIRFSCEELTLDAAFGPFLQIESDIMGCFRFGTPCKHKIISMKHSVTVRKCVLQGTEMPIEHAIGYAEKDWGKSFPKSYCWLQCNDFEDAGTSFFCSVADIGFPFRGLICSLLTGGREFRFATYNFAKIEKLSRGELVLKKSNLRLHVHFSENESQTMLAPDRGKMARTIKEDLSGTLDFELFERDRLIARSSGKNAGIEWVNL